MIPCAQHCTRKFLGSKDTEGKKQPYATKSNTNRPIWELRGGGFLARSGIKPGLEGWTEAAKGTADSKRKIREGRGERKAGHV